MLASAGSPAEAAGGDTVVLVHGMGRTKRSMGCLGDQLSRQGFRIVHFAYPSTRQDVATSAFQLQQLLQAMGGAEAGRVHFVTHSLGGIVVRACLKRHRPSNLGRVVMLSPPNRGSEVADKLRHNLFYRWATGPAGLELGTGPDSVPNDLGPVAFPLGVIAGNRSLNPLFSAWLEGPDDGKVSVTRSRVDGMADFLVVPRSHTYIMRSSQVISQVAHFLECGTFNHTPA